MNVVIVGTSNSLIKNGFKEGFSNSKDLQITNLSIGGCCAIQHVERMLSHQKIMVEADILILDSLVNDIVFSMTGEAEIPFMLDAITAMYEIASSMNKPVFSVLFPTKHHLGEIEGNELYEHHISECKRLSIAVIDLYSICNGMVSKEIGFLDGPHIAPVFSKIVGDALGIYCAGKHNFRAFDKANYQPPSRNVGEYQYLVRNLPFELKDSSEFNVIEKKNSQFLEKFIFLKSTLQLEVINAELLGILQWSDKEAGPVSIETNPGKEAATEIKPSNGLFRFSNPKKPIPITSKLVIKPATVTQSATTPDANASNRVLIRTLLLRKKLPATANTLELKLAERPRINTQLLELQIRKSFSAFNAGIMNTITHINVLANKLDNEERKVVSGFLNGLHN